VICCKSFPGANPTYITADKRSRGQIQKTYKLLFWHHMYTQWLSEKGSLVAIPQAKLFADVKTWQRNTYSLFYSGLMISVCLFMHATFSGSPASAKVDARMRPIGSVVLIWVVTTIKCGKNGQQHRAPVIAGVNKDCVRAISRGISSKKLRQSPIHTKQSGHPTLLDDSRKVNEYSAHSASTLG